MQDLLIFYKDIFFHPSIAGTRFVYCISFIEFYIYIHIYIYIRFSMLGISGMFYIGSIRYAILRRFAVLWGSIVVKALRY
jgi:hypothetical protein